MKALCFLSLLWPVVFVIAFPAPVPMHDVNLTDEPPNPDAASKSLEDFIAGRVNQAKTQAELAIEIANFEELEKALALEKAREVQHYATIGKLGKPSSREETSPRKSSEKSEKEERPKVEEPKKNEKSGEGIKLSFPRARLGLKKIIKWFSVNEEKQPNNSEMSLVSVDEFC